MSGTLEAVFHLASSTELKPAEQAPRRKSSVLAMMWGAITSRKTQPAEVEFEPHELAERLRLNSPLLVDELYQIALRQIQSETGRQTRLDAKANTLLTATGLSLTVAFTFGGQFLIAKSEELRLAGEIRWKTIVVLFAFSVITGLASSLIAIWALQVRSSYRSVDEQSVFNNNVLKNADQADTDEAGLTQYKRYLIIELWQIAQAHGRTHEKKASLILFGQFFFMAFLLGLLCICFFMATSVRY